MQLKNLLVGIALATVSVALTLLCAELLVRTFAPVDLSTAWRMPAPHGQLYYVNIPGVDVTHTFDRYSTHYKINSLGTRGPEPRAEAQVNVVFLGDSFTFGLYVDEPATEVGLIRALAEKSFGPRVTITNAAIAASGIAEWIAYLEDYGTLLKPKLIVANLNYVSFSRGYHHPLYDLNCADHALLRRSPVDTHEAPRPRTQEGYSGSIKRVLLENSQLAVTIARAIHRIRSAHFSSPADTEPKPDASPAPHVTPPTGGFFVPELPFEASNIDVQDVRCFVEASLKSLKDVADRLGAKLLVVDIGYRWQTQLTHDRSIDLVALDFVPQALKELGVPLLDLTPAMLAARQKGEPLEIPGDGHPSERAYQILAQETWPVLKTELEELLAGR